MPCVRNDVVAWCEVDGRIVVLQSEDSTYLAVNRTGAALWPRLLAGATTDDLVGVLVARYGLARERAEGDVSSFLHALSSRRLLEP